MDALLEHDLVHSAVVFHRKYSHCTKSSLELYMINAYCSCIIIYNHVLNDEKSDMLCE